MLHRLAELDARSRAGLRGLRLQARRRGAAQQLHDRRPLGLLLRHPQGRALLRSRSRAPTRARGAHGDRRDSSAASSTWLAPMLAFTTEEAWLARYPSADGSVHLETFPRRPGRLARRGARGEVGEDPPRAPRRHRRARDRAGGEAHRLVARGRAGGLRRRRRRCCAALDGVDFAEVCITSAAELMRGRGAGGRLPPRRRPGRRGRAGAGQGRKCARSWKISTRVGADPDYPDVTPRDAAALREWERVRKAAQ